MRVLKRRTESGGYMKWYVGLNLFYYREGERVDSICWVIEVSMETNFVGG
jgi:hypothetical protein